MSEMIERVAKAIWPDAFLGDGPGWHQRRDVAMDQARAAIKAMREPTDQMIKAGTISWDPMDGGPIRPVFEPSKPYSAMIDAALKE